MGKVTIEDISRHTNLSRGTVSRALNNRSDISEQTKQRVLAAVRELQYVPSHAARALATGRRYAALVLVDDAGTAFAGSFLRGVTRRAREDRYAIQMLETSPAADEWVDYLRTLVTERVDCVLSAAPFPPDAAERAAQLLTDRRVVSVTPVTPNADVLAPDYAEAGRLAARRIVRPGQRNVLYAHVPGTPDGDLRRQGFCEACAAVGVDPHSVVVEVSPHERDPRARLGALASRLESADAVAACDDYLAIEIMLLCRSLGREPGRDIGIVGYGAERVGTRVHPALTTIDPRADELGQRALDLALQRVVAARQDAPQQILIPPEIIERESTRNIP